MSDTCRAMPQRESYFRRQRILAALFKDRRKVKSLLKKGSHSFQKEKKFFLGKGFKRRLMKL